MTTWIIFIVVWVVTSIALFVKAAVQIANKKKEEESKKQTENKNETLETVTSQPGKKKNDAQETEENQQIKKKNELDDLLRNGFSPAQSVYEGYEGDIYLMRLENKILDVEIFCSGKKEECSNNHKKITADAEIIRKNICKAMDVLSEKIRPENATVDNLVELYKTGENVIDEPDFQSALAKCKEENIAEVAEIVKMNEERQKLCEKAKIQMEIIDELSDARNSVARDVWKFEYCEQAYKVLVAMKNDPNYIHSKEVLAKVERFEDRSFYVTGEAGGSLCRMSRSGNEFAIWSIGGSFGVVRPVDDILYWMIKTEESTYTSCPTSSKSPSRIGIALDEAIWGTAAATAKAMEMQQKQQDVTKISCTTRKAIIYFKYESQIKPFTTLSKSDTESLKEIFPEKDANVASQLAQQSGGAQMQNLASQQAVQINNIEMLKKYKELLDIGAISQEEFDAQKEKLLK